MVALQSQTGSLFQKSQVCRQTMLHVSNTGPQDARPTLRALGSGITLPTARNQPHFCPRPFDQVLVPVNVRTLRVGVVEHRSITSTIQVNARGAGNTGACTPRSRTHADLAKASCDHDS